MGVSMDLNDWSCKLESHKSYFKTGVTIPVAARIEALRSLQKALKANEEEVLQALKTDLNKPDIEAFLSEIYFLIEEMNLICKKLSRWLKPQKVGNPIYFWPAKSWVEKRPYGTVLVIGPWNYPVQLALAPVVAAVAAGNTVVVKPSEVCPAVESVLTKIIAEAFPEEWVSCATGGVEVSEALLALDFDFVFFTGSTAVGKMVDTQLAGRLIPRVMELGGKCPCVVSDPKSIEHTASRVVTGKFFTGGQTCFSPDFVAVSKANTSKLIEALQKELEKRYDEDYSEDLAFPPSERHAERLAGLRREGELVFQLGNDEGRSVAPSLVKIDRVSKLLEEEVFGPILPIVEFTSEEELAEILDPLESPLALYIFAQNEELIEQLVESFPSGAVCINDTMKQGSNLNLPFGGVGESGMGRYRGKWGVDQFSYLRSFTRRYMVHDLFETVPPYKGALEKMKKLLRWK